MAITIDKASMTVLPTGDPLIVEITLDYTKDDLATVEAWQAKWKSVTFSWNTNRPAAEFMAAVQEAIQRERTEAAAQKAVKQSIVDANTSNFKTGLQRADPSPLPGLGTAENPMYVKVVP
jgi:hypothetical protein